MPKPRKPRAAKPVTEKKPTPPKKTKTDKQPKTTAAKRYNSPINEQDKALFLSGLNKVIAGRDAVAKAVNALRIIYKQSKADGFVKGDFDVAIAIQGADGEKKKKAAIARDLTIAKWLGCDLGAQLDMFMEDERVPAAERAYSEGQSDSMQGKSASPAYDPSTEQHREYMRGFHEDQENRLKKGIKKLDPEGAEQIEKDAAVKEKSEAQRKEDSKEFEAPTSGTPVTREQFKAMQQQTGAAGNAEALFKKKAQ